MFFTVSDRFSFFFSFAFISFVVLLPSFLFITFSWLYYDYKSMSFWFSSSQSFIYFKLNSLHFPLLGIGCELLSIELFFYFVYFILFCISLLAIFVGLFTQTCVRVCLHASSCACCCLYFMFYALPSARHGNVISYCLLRHHHRHHCQLQHRTSSSTITIITTSPALAAVVVLVL